MGLHEQRRDNRLMESNKSIHDKHASFRDPGKSIGILFISYLLLVLIMNTRCFITYIKLIIMCD